MTIVTVEPMQPPTPPNRGCRAKNRQGTLCGAPAIKGLTKCRMHAGVDLTTARLKGLSNLAALTPLAIEHLAATLTEPMVPEPVRLAAAKIILDVGLDPRAAELVARIDRKTQDTLVDVLVAFLDHLGLEGEAREEALEFMRAEFKKFEVIDDE
jgi:hypothetical protein